MSTGFATDAIDGRRRAQVGAQRRGERGDLEPVADRRIGRDDPRASRVRKDREPRAVEGEPRPEDLGGAEQVADRVHPEDARLLEQRVVEQVPARLRERAGVAERGALPGRRAPALDHQHRLVLRHLARRLEEISAVGQALDVEEDDPGRRVPAE